MDGILEKVTLSDDEGGGVVEEEEDNQWRKERLEREQFLNSNKRVKFVFSKVFLILILSCTIQFTQLFKFKFYCIIISIEIHMVASYFLGLFLNQ